MKEKLHFETNAIQNLKHLPDSKPVSAPIHLSTTYERSEDGTYTNDFIYSRISNPNREVLERTIADLEGGASCLAFASTAFFNNFFGSIFFGAIIYYLYVK